MFEGQGLLRAALLSGLMLLIAFGAGLAVLYTAGAHVSAARREVAFHQLLSNYDFRFGQMLGAGQGAQSYQFESLSRDLDHMEARVEVVENWLSVLKRRRQLADRAAEVPGLGSRYVDLYRQSSRRALRDFPFSEPIVAVAAAAIVRDAAITREMEDELRELLPRLTSASYVPMRLDFHVLLGDFHSPGRAATSLLEDGGLALDFAISATGQGAEAVLTSLIILRILEDEPWRALPAIQSALAGGLSATSPGFVRFAAEFFYDFGSPFRAAELFAMLPGEEALSRQADAWWLAGDTENARNIWSWFAMPRARSDRTRYPAETMAFGTAWPVSSARTRPSMSWAGFSTMADSLPAAVPAASMAGSWRA